MRKLDLLTYEGQFNYPVPHEQSVELTDLQRQIVEDLSENWDINFRFSVKGFNFDYHNGTFFLQINTLKQGQAFGEVALVSQNAMRNATILCEAKSVHCATLSKESFQRTIDLVNARYRQSLLNFSQQIPCFGSLKKVFLQKFVTNFSKYRLVRNQTLYKEGDKVQYVVIVKKGEFELTRALTKPDKWTELSSLIKTQTKPSKNVLANKLSEIPDVPQI